MSNKASEVDKLLKEILQKQFGFKEGHSTNHAHIQLINNICD